MTKNFYAKQFKPRTRKILPKHLALDRLFQVTKKRKFSESTLSKICVGRFRHIFVTSRERANSLTAKMLKIKAILTIGQENRLNDDVICQVEAYEVCNAQDLSTHENVAAFRKSFLPQTRRFLKNWLSRGNVLIHCKRGVCRSPLIVLDYLINILKMDCQEAGSLLLQERNCARPTATLLQTLF